MVGLSAEGLKGKEIWLRIRFGIHSVSTHVERPYYKLDVHNPFNPSTSIQFDVKGASSVSLVIFNVLGQKVMAQNHEEMNAGRYNENVNMDGFASEVYLYMLTASSYTSVKKMLLRK